MRKLTLDSRARQAYRGLVTRKQTPIAIIRKARTLSQQDMARLLGVSQQTLSKFETGRLAPDAAVRVRMAAILGVSENELFEAKAS